MRTAATAWRQRGRTVAATSSWRQAAARLWPRQAAVWLCRRQAARWRWRQAARQRWRPRPRPLLLAAGRRGQTARQGRARRDQRLQSLAPPSPPDATPKRIWQGCWEADSGGKEGGGGKAGGVWAWGGGGGGAPPPPPRPRRASPTPSAAPPPTRPRRPPYPQSSHPSPTIPLPTTTAAPRWPARAPPPGGGCVPPAQRPGPAAAPRGATHCPGARGHWAGGERPGLGGRGGEGGGAAWGAARATAGVESWAVQVARQPLGRPEDVRVPVPRLAGGPMGDTTAPSPATAPAHAQRARATHRRTHPCARRGWP